jgi:hypothetical protein
MPGPGPADLLGTAHLLLGAPSYGVGWQDVVYLPNPPAGQVWSYTVDGRYYERLLLVRQRFTASAVAANRFPAVDLFGVDGAVVTEVPAGNNVVANGVVTANLAVGGSGYALGSTGGTFGFLPDVLVPPGWGWRASVSGMDAGDQLAGIVLVVQRYPTAPADLIAAG